MNLEQRFWSKVEPPVGIGECWKWKAATNNDGHGRFHYQGKWTTAYRIAYELLKGKIPEGLEIDHLCRNPTCVNPYHLEAVTPRENILRGEGCCAKNAGKTHCKNGHPLSGDNLVKYQLSRGQRNCRICKNQSRRRTA